MKIPTQPGRMQKAAPRKGRRRKQKTVTPPTVYAILNCCGCVTGCVSGEECKPPRAYVHGACLNLFLLKAPSMVNGVSGEVKGDCLYCHKPLIEESKAP